MRQLDELTPEEIRAAAAAVAAAEDERWVTVNRRLLPLVAERLGSSWNDDEAFPATRYLRADVTRRYEGRVKRALEALAESGALVKVGAGQRTPDGLLRLSNREVRYYTPEAFAAAKEEGEKRRAEALAVEARWDVVRRRLGAVEVNLRPNGSLYLVDWEHLLEATGL